MKLKPYPAYKDSGIPWLGRVPEHWNMRRLKFLLREIDTRSVTGGEQLLRVSQYTGVTPRNNLNVLNEFNTRATSLVGYKCVTINDLVINIMLAWNGSLGISSYNGIVSPAYCVYRFQPEVEPWFYHHLLRTPLYKERIKTSSTGVVESRLRLYSDDLGRVEAILPPLKEQIAIAHFLNHINSKIDRYIRAKKKLIALLNEQKQAIIHRAVTRGLDPNVRLKPSGVEWLGDIPEHWELLPLKSVCLIQSGITLGKTYSSEKLKEYPYLRVANVQAGNLDLKLVKTISLPENEAYRSMLRVGDVLMTEGGDPDKLGRGCVWEGQLKTCLHQNHVFAVRPNTQRLYPYFLSALLSSEYAKAYFLLTAKQTTNLASTNKTTIGQFRVLLPNIKEQRNIFEQLTNDLNPVNEAIARTQHEISLIHEYRTRLIGDVVTGKLDVCNVELPEIDQLGDLNLIDTNEELETEELTDMEELSYADD
jgi:type I restriction enzyme, S subunit